MLETHPQIRFRGKKLAVIVDFISCSPSIFQNAFKKENIQKGFLAAGMIDEGSKSAPDLNAILGTVVRTLKKAEMDLVVMNFNRLYSEALKHGEITDDLFDELGFPIDLDMNGRPMLRYAGIRQEPYQRAKNLSHKAQQKLRQEEMERAKQLVDDKNALANVRINKRLEENRKCEDIVLDAMGLSREQFKSGVASFRNAEIKHFHQPKLALLAAFVRVRSDNPSSNPKNKGTLAEALAGEKRTLTRVAFDLRETEIKLKLIGQEGSNKKAMEEDLTSAVIHEVVTVGTTPADDLSFFNQTWSQAVVTCFLASKSRKPFFVEFSNTSANHQCLLQILETLSKLLQSRLKRHIETRIVPDHPQKANHWCLIWAHQMLPRVAGIMLLMGHIVD
jgi:hypothetical protein